jgi:hypothetical protein
MILAGNAVSLRLPPPGEGNFLLKKTALGIQEILCMEELFELKSFIQKGQYADALLLIGEMEEQEGPLLIKIVKTYWERKQ